MGFVQRDTKHPSTRRWVRIWYTVGMLYSVLALRCALYEQFIMFITMAVMPFTVRQLLTIWLHMRIYPYRNGVVKGHILRALSETSLWKTKGDKKLKILDFGCGQGDTSWMLRQIFGKDVEIYSVDVYEAPRWIGGKSKRVTYDGEKLPFEDKEFDFAIAGQVLHHIPDNAQSVSEMARTSKTMLIVEDLINVPEGEKSHQAHPFLSQPEFCYFWDSLWNWDFFDNPPHTNRSHSEWLGLFDAVGMRCAYCHGTSFAFGKDLAVKQKGMGGGDGDETDISTQMFEGHKSALANGLYFLETK